MEPRELKRLIEQRLPGSQASVTGDGRHFQAVVISDRFVGKTLLEQHRLVYAALADRLGTEALHALSLSTRAAQ